jgi:hypothetical protein
MLLTALCELIIPCIAIILKLGIAITLKLSITLTHMIIYIIIDVKSC